MSDDEAPPEYHPLRHLRMESPGLPRRREDCPVCTAAVPGVRCGEHDEKPGPTDAVG